MSQKKTYDLLNGKYLALVAIMFALIASINTYFAVAIGGVALAYFIYLLLGEELLIAFTIVTFLTITEKMGETIRLTVQITNFMVLILLFAKNYGTKFSDYPRIPKNMKIFLSLLYSAFLLSFVFTSYKSLALSQILRTTVFLILVYLYYSLINSEKAVKIIINTIIAITLGVGIYLFYEFYLSNFDLLHLNAKLFNPEVNLYVHKNTYAIYFAISIPLLISKYLSSDTDIQKILTASLILFFSTGLVITNSRSVLFALFFAIIYLIYKINKKYLLYPVILIILLLPFVFIEPFSGWLDIYFRVERISTGRDWIMQTLLNIPWQHYIFGTGPAATQFYMWQYLPFQIGSPEQLWMEHHFKMLTYGHAHNFYLFYFSDLGILGLAASLFLVFVFFSEGQKTKNYLNDNDKLFSLGLKAAGLTIFIRGIFEWSGILSYGEINKDLPFWLIFITLIVLKKQGENEKRTS